MEKKRSQQNAGEIEWETKGEPGLLDDFRHLNLLVGGRGSVEERLLLGQLVRFRGDVLPDHVEDVLGMRRGFDAFDLDGLELFHVSENLVHLRLVGRDFLIGEADAGEVSDVPNVHG